MSKQIVVINESHTLLDAQVKILDAAGPWVVWNVPTKGMTAEEQREAIYTQLGGALKPGDTLVFASPVPYMMGVAVREAAISHYAQSPLWMVRVALFSNDRREKVEKPDGTIFMKVAPDGWELLTITS